MVRAPHPHPCSRISCPSVSWALWQLSSVMEECINGGFKGGGWGLGCVEPAWQAGDERWKGGEAGRAGEGGEGCV